MSDTYCEECGVEVCVQDDVAESCTSCREVVFYLACAQKLKRDPPYILMCDTCDEDYHLTMLEYETTAEQEAIGDRYGGYDQYDNMGEAW